MSSPAPAALEARYTWGGDEFLFVEVSESHEPGRQFQGHVHRREAFRAGADGHRGHLPGQRLVAGAVRSRRPAAVDP